MSITSANKKLIGIYFLIVCLDSISFSLIAPILAPLLASSSEFFAKMPTAFLRYFSYGALIALFPLAYTISSPIFGWLSDRYGRKNIIMASLILTLLAFISYIGAFNQQSILLLALGRILAGSGGASECTAQAAVVDLTLQNRKANVISLIALGMTVGLAFGPLIASLWTIHSSTTIFSWIIVLSLINLALLGFSKATSPATAATVNTSNTSAWKFLWQSKELKRLLAVFLLFELGWSLYYQALPLMLSLHWHLNNQQVGWANAYIGAALTILLAFATRAGLHYLSAKKLICLGFIIGAIALFLSLFDVKASLFLLYGFPVVLMVALVYPCLIAEISDLAQNHQGFVIGIAAALLSLAFTITGFTSSLLIYANYNLPIAIALILWIIACSLIYKGK